MRRRSSRGWVLPEKSSQPPDEFDGALGELLEAGNDEGHFAPGGFDFFRAFCQDFLRLFSSASFRMPALARVVAEEPVLNLYTARHYDGDDLIYEAFKKKTGIEVKETSASADQIISRLKGEGAEGPEDVLTRPPLSPFPALPVVPAAKSKFLSEKFLSDKKPSISLVS